MGDDVTMLRRISLAGRIHKMIPELRDIKVKYNQNFSGKCYRRSILKGISKADAFMTSVTVTFGMLKCHVSTTFLRDLLYLLANISWTILESKECISDHMHIALRGVII